MPKSLQSNKGILGKLLASENIRIEYRPVQTASFDMTSRVLTLPLWGIISDDMMDLFVGHEVGHALYTPAEGWNAKYDSNDNNIFHHIIQVVEDVRIERKIKARYPGLMRPMYRGYSELVELGFFGCGYEQMRFLPFLDRINLYYKLGVRSGITFRDDEQPTIRRLDAMNTWEDGLALMDEIWAMMLNECEDFREIFEKKTPAENERTSMKQRRSLVEEANSALRKKIKKWMEDVQKTEGESFTYDTFETKSKKLTNTKTRIEYATLPTLNLRHYVLDRVQTHRILEEELSVVKPTRKMEERYTSFMEDHLRTVNYMAKEFELRKWAKLSARGVTGKTGELNVNKLWKYRLSPELFVQNTIVPGGKSHGMMLLVDMSGSMMKCIRSTMEQVVVLTMFCRRVGIPFEVYGFMDNGYFKHESKMLGVNQFERYYDTKAGEYTIYHENFRMKQLLVSAMSAKEYRTAVRNLLVVADVLSEKRYSLPSVVMNGTPLLDALVVTKQLIEEFRAKTRCEIMNLILLTDGDGSGLVRVKDKKDKTRTEEITMGDRLGFIDRKSGTTLITDTTMWKAKHAQGLMLNMIRECTGARIIGFYLVTRKFKDMVEQDTNILDFDQAWDNAQKNRYHLAVMDGYERFYLMPANKLDMEAVEWTDVSQVEDIGKRSRMLTTSLKKIQKKKKISKLFLNSFVQSIS